MHLHGLESSWATLRFQNMFDHLTWLFSDLEIPRALGPDMVPILWDVDYEENRIMFAKMVFERRNNEKFDNASAGILIQFLFRKKTHRCIYIIVLINYMICVCSRPSKCQ